MSLKRIYVCFLHILLVTFVCSAQECLELPKIKSNEIIVRHTGHTLSYNPRWLIPNWTAYELTPDELEGDALRAKKFTTDPNLEGYPRAEHWYYTNSGWVRGHMVPAGDLKNSQKAMDESFYTSNICPMNMAFNNGIWKRLEEKIRKWAVQYGHVYIITGPIMGRNVNGKVGESDIFIPDKFFKAVLVPYNKSFLTIGFIMANDDSTKGKLKDCAITVDELEHIISMDLFTNLKKGTERLIEDQFPIKQLGLY